MSAIQRNNSSNLIKLDRKALSKKPKGNRRKVMAIAWNADAADWSTGFESGIIPEGYIIKGGVGPPIILREGERLISIQGDILPAAETFNFQRNLTNDLSVAARWGNINKASDGTLFTLSIGEDGDYVLDKDETARIAGSFRLRTANTTGKFSLTLYILRMYPWHRDRAPRYI